MRHVTIDGRQLCLCAGYVREKTTQLLDIAHSKEKPHADMTPAQLAKLSEMPEKSIERVVADDFLGIRRLTMDVICRALDCQPGDLLKYEAQ